MKRLTDWLFDSIFLPARISIGLLLLRLMAGGMMLGAHGWPKLQKFNTLLTKFPDPIGLGSELSLILAVGAEALGSLLIMLGLLTRASAIPLLFTMLVAAFVVHGDDPLQKQEFALLYASAFATLLFTGPGRYSLDSLLAKQRDDRAD